MKVRHMAKTRYLALAFLLGHAVPTMAESPIAPFAGTWRINFERSYARALADENLPERNPNALRQHVELRAQICELSISDSLIAFSRGRHTVEMSYEILEQEGNEIALSVQSDRSSATWDMTLVEGRYLLLLSSATRFDDFYVYERGSIPRNEDGTPKLLPPRKMHADLSMPSGSQPPLDDLN